MLACRAAPGLAQGRASREVLRGLQPCRESGCGAGQERGLRVGVLEAEGPACLQGLRKEGRAGGSVWLECSEGRCCGCQEPGEGRQRTEHVGRNGDSALRAMGACGL